MSDSSFEELSSLLFRERALLGRLVSRRHDAGELEDGCRSISGLELQRAIVARAVAAKLGMDGDVGLPELIAAAPTEWSDVLTDHRRALLEVAERLQLRAVVRPRTRPGDPDGPPGDPAVVDASPTVQRSLREFLDPRR